ncbi:histidine kinase [Sinorhizobium sp. NFACC03]|uniref:sensor histidine kinase n=1 Tax=Sinorhizobium sp. NFACC03 TaxID=1566295 RepID=UPI00088338D5|nr:histidine kinase [Sinorhizobium sp. NFACC03]SDA93693.1 Histidine kinase [Sinorhizobium sp. NFACC03]
MKHIAIPTDSFLDGRFRATTLRLALIYAAAELLITSPIWLIIGDNPLKPFLGKLVLEAVFVVLAILFAQLLSRMRDQPYATQTLACLLLSLVSSLGMSLLDSYLYALIMSPVVVPFNIMDYGYAVCYRMSIFFGWSFLFVALLNHMDVRDRDLKLIASREEALAAQMRALQYQINPHFLFNTLNSITGVVEEGASQRAERMIMSLSAFLRSTLQLDPMRELRLADELALQKEYLDIEKERFSDRMIVRIDIPTELESAMVPSLILQPLVENAVKHGVGGSADEVEIHIRAGWVGETLYLSVENDVAASDKTGDGLGIGLANVAHRVKTHFPEGASLTAGYIEPTRYRVSLKMPLRIGRAEA